MVDRILVLHRLDIAPAEQLAKQLAAQGGEPPVLTVLDPSLHTYAVSTGLRSAQLLNLRGGDVDSAEAAARALSAARIISGEADTLLSGLIPAARGAAWLSFWFRTLHTTAYGCRSIARTLAPHVARDQVHLLLPDVPHRYGYHSYVPGQVMHRVLREAGQTPRLWTNPVPPHDPVQLPDPWSAPEGMAPELLCCVPTCFHDSALFTAELLASGKSVLVLPSPVYDVPTDGLPRCSLALPDQLAERLDSADLQALEALLPRLAALLMTHIEPLLGHAGMAQRQVDVIVEGYRQNMLLYLALQGRFGRQAPKTLLISNHDVGLHGAMVSFARQHGLRIVMVPHAKIFNSVVPSYDQDVLCLTHPMQGGEVIDVDGCRMATGLLDFGRSLQLPSQPPKPLATLGIVLNAVSANTIMLLDMHIYMHGLQQLLAWCSAHGVHCRVRCRPNGSILPMVSARLGIDAEELARQQQGSLVDFAQGCDLVLGYDVPTSGAFDLLEQGLPVLQTLCRRLEPEQLRMADERIVPRLSVADTLQQLDRFVAEPLALWRYRRSQHARLVAASAEAQPLRAWL